MKIVTVTMNPVIDMTSSVKQVLPEHKLRCRQPDYAPGGGGITVSRAIKKLGGNSTAYFTAGGSKGEMLENFLNEEGIDCRGIEIEGTTRENITISEESSEKQYRFVMPGPEIKEQEYEQALEIIEKAARDADFVVASGSLPPGVPVEFYAELAKVAGGAGAKVVVDTSGEALCKAVKEDVFLIKPNLKELSDIIGHELNHDDEIIAAARAIIRKNRCEAVIVSIGQGGAIFVTADKTEHIRTPTVPVKSKVGAGDSMVAGIILKLSQGEDLSLAAKYGVAAGAAAVMTPGIELCRKEDTENIFSKMD